MSRHEAPELGDAIVRMLRALVTRAGDGDTEAIEQLQRVEQLAPAALTYGLREASGFGYSFTELAQPLGVSRQAARQRTQQPPTAAARWYGDVHQLEPGHHKGTCTVC